MVYLHGLRPFERPVILGSERVAFSALLTCRHAGFRRLAMVAPEPHPLARWPAAWLPRLLAIPLFLQTDLTAIRGDCSVTAVDLRGPDGQTRRLETDGVLITGQILPEAALLRASHLAIDPATGGPEVDEQGRCSDPADFAAGNLLRAVETEGWCWSEGQRAASAVALDLAGKAACVPQLRIRAEGEASKYVLPQRLGSGAEIVQFRVTRPLQGRLTLTLNGTEIQSVPLSARPERRLKRFAFDKNQTTALGLCFAHISSENRFTHFGMRSNPATFRPARRGAGRTGPAHRRGCHMRFLALDQGTTSTRALVFDTDGHAEVLLALPLAQHSPQPGWVEHDPEALLTNLRAGLAAAATKRISAIGLANQGESCVAWNALTGRPISPVIVWQDGRTADVTARLRYDGAGPLVRDKAGLPLDPYFSAAKLGWIMQNIPEAQTLLALGRLRLGTAAAVFLDRLTGQFVTDLSTASRTSLMNLTTCHWDADLCHLFGVPIAALPQIVSGTANFGMVDCGGPVPITASLVDQQASLYGHGCREPGQSKITFGTGAFALTLTDTLHRPTPDGPLPTIAWQRPGQPQVYALEGGVHCASTAVNWAHGLGLFREYNQINRFDTAPAIDRGLVFVPALTGLACPHWDRSALGAWLGLALDTTPADMMQAVLEGVALRTAEVLRAIAAVQPLRNPISIDGGMSANPYFCQFLADTLNRAILASDQPELTAFGIARPAAEAVGADNVPANPGRLITPQHHNSGRTATFSLARSLISTFGQR